MAELKPCPKCGSTNVEVAWSGTIGGRWSNGRCRDCRHFGPKIDGWDNEAATEKWNAEAGRA